MARISLYPPDCRISVTLSGSRLVSKPGPVMESRLTTCVMPSMSLSSSHRSETWVALRSS